MTESKGGEPHFEVRLLPRAGALTVFEVLAPGRRSTLETVREELFRLRIQIVRGECLVQEGHLIERFRVVEFDGAPLGKRRASAVLKAIRDRLASATPHPMLRWARHPGSNPSAETSGSSG